MTLAATQRAFQARILEEDASLPQGWDERMEGGLAVYRNNYRTQLITALQEAFPRTLAWAGAESFDRAAAHHLILHPPTGWTLDDAGRGFPETLGTLFANDPEVGELAWLEWAMHSASVARDCTALSPADFASLTANFADADWAQLRLGFVSDLAFRTISTACAELWNYLAGTAQMPSELTLDEPAALIVWREKLSPVFRCVPARSAECLEHMRAGATLGGLCESYASRDDAMGGAEAVGMMLGQWVQDGLVAAVLSADGRFRTFVSRSI